MLKRIVAAFLALPLFFFAVYFTPDWVLPVLLGLLSGLAAYEMLHNTGLLKNTVLLSAAVFLSVIAVPLTVFLALPLPALVIPSTVLLFAIVLFSREKVTAAAIFGTFFAVIFFPMALGSVARIRAMDEGVSLVLLPFLAAWITDTFAYFTGLAFGRHKLAPAISPKKTVEGAIGGVLGCIAVMIAYHYVAAAIWHVTFDLPWLLLIAALGSVISQLGDLSMSYLKRDFGIKDYGAVMPGHGGVLDRFDSLLFTAPLIELLLTYVTVIL